MYHVQRSVVLTRTHDNSALAGSHAGNGSESFLLLVRLESAYSLILVRPLYFRKRFYYRPQRSCGKVMFLHVPVILFGGGLSAPLGSLGRPHPGQTPPGQMPCLDRHLSPADTPTAQCMLG